MAISFAQHKWSTPHQQTPENITHIRVLGAGKTKLSSNCVCWMRCWCCCWVRHRWKFTKEFRVFFDSLKHSEWSSPITITTTSSISSSYSINSMGLPTAENTCIHFPVTKTRFRSWPQQVRPSRTSVQWLGTAWIRARCVKEEQARAHIHAYIHTHTHTHAYTHTHSENEHMDLPPIVRHTIRAELNYTCSIWFDFTFERQRNSNLFVQLKECVLCFDTVT